MMKSIEYALEETVDFLEKCSHGSTNQNESFHAKNARVTPKDKSFGISFKARVALAVLMWNEPIKWYDIVCQVCGIKPISEEHHCQLLELLEKKRSHNSKENILSQRIKRNKARKEKRKEKPDPSGHNEAHNPKLSSEKDVHDMHRNTGVHLYGVFPRIGNNDYAISSLQLLHNTQLPEIFTMLPPYFQNRALFSDLSMILNKLTREKAVDKEPFKRFVSLMGYNEENRIPVETFIKKSLLSIRDELVGDINANNALDFINNMFGFMIQGEYHCQNCRLHQIRMPQHEYCIQLQDFDGAKTLQQLLDEFSCQGIQSGSACPRCGQELSLKQNIIHFPYHPIFAFNKFSSSGAIKENTIIAEEPVLVINSTAYDVTHIINFKGNNINNPYPSGYRCFVKRKLNIHVIEYVDTRSYETEEQTLPIDSTTCLLMLTPKEAEVNFEEPPPQPNKSPVIEHETSSESLLPYQAYVQSYFSNEKPLDSMKVLVVVINFIEHEEKPQAVVDIESHIRTYNHEIWNLVMRKARDYIRILLSIKREIFVPYKYLKSTGHIDKRATFFGLAGIEYPDSFVRKKKE